MKELNESSKYEVAKTLSKFFESASWIDEIDCHDGFKQVLDNPDGTPGNRWDMSQWYMGKDEDSFGTFIDIEVNMDNADGAYDWYRHFCTSGYEDEFGNYLDINYDESEDCAEMRNDDVTEEGYEYPPDHIEICLKSQTHLRQLAEGCEEFNKEKNK
jgi:hypothetical protein